MTPEQVIADALDEYEGLDSMRHLAIILTKALCAAGLLPGPDDIVVSREALDPRRALSQPHPAQEQQ